MERDEINSFLHKIERTLHRQSLLFFLDKVSHGDTVHIQKQFYVPFASVIFTLRLLNLSIDDMVDVIKSRKRNGEPMS